MEIRLTLEKDYQERVFDLVCQQYEQERVMGSTDGISQPTINASDQVEAAA